MIKPLANGTMVSGIACSEHLDSAGERLNIAGIDISSLSKDGVLNHEHKNDNTSHILGKILFAKKIFKEDDCDTVDQLKWWNQCKVPFVYIVGELFDGTGHQAAKELAAILKYDHIASQKDPNFNKVIGFSIEGSKLHTEKNGEIKEAIARKVTCTVHPCNKMATAGLYIPEEDKELSSIDKIESSFLNLFKTQPMVHEINKLISKTPSWHDNAMKDLKDKKWKKSITFINNVKAVSLSHPQHGTISMVHDPERETYHIKHNGAVVTMPHSQTHEYNDEGSAFGSLIAYANMLHSKDVNPKQMFDSPSPNMTNPLLVIRSSVGRKAVKKSADAPPSTLVNQNALQKESLVSKIKKKANAAYSTWDKAEILVKHMKEKYPNISDSTIRAAVKMYALKRQDLLEKWLNKLKK